MLYPPPPPPQKHNVVRAQRSVVSRSRSKDLLIRRLTILVHYVANTSIGKRVVGLRLKGLATSAFSPHCWAELNRLKKKTFWWTHAPVLDFCWCLLWVPKPELAVLFTWQRCMWCAFAEIHLWYNTCWSLDDQHGSQLLFPISVFQQR